MKRTVVEVVQNCDAFNHPRYRDWGARPLPEEEQPSSSPNGVV